MKKITEIDFSILYWIQEHIRNDMLDGIMPYITYLGSAGIFWILTALVMICMKQRRRCGIMMLAGMLAGLLITNIILKNTVARDRPCWIDTDIRMLIAIPKDFSFPSGHTTASVISAMILFHEDKKIGIAAWILAILIIFSRMYLFVHFPTDILCGAVIGAVIGYLTPILMKKVFQKYEKAPA